MPPKKGKAKAAPAAPPLDGCAIALSGTLKPYTQATLESELIQPLGASLEKSINASTTHLVTTESDFKKPSVKVKQAQANGVHIVKLAWLEECSSQNKKLSEDAYGFENEDDADDKKNADPASNGKAIPTRKRSVAKVEDDVELDVKPVKKTKAAANGKASQSQIDDVKTESKNDVKSEVEEGGMNIAKSTDMNIPLDETCPLLSYKVYIDEDGLIYDAALNQTNAGHNNNKFYRIQLLQNGADYKTWTRWGRVGENGASAILGTGSLTDALKQFDAKFKGKTGHSWANRANSPKAGKYTYIERSYEADSDDEADEKPEVKAEEEEAPVSTLAPPIQDLLGLIFNQQYFAATYADLNYDVKKLPLGKLSKTTITRGYQALKELAALFDDNSLAQSEYQLGYQAAVEHLSNSFYSLIPHDFGRNRPPIIQNQDLLKKEVEMLESLGEMKESAAIMKREIKDSMQLSILDRQFKGLGMDEMTPLKNSSIEFRELQKYLTETCGSTHNTKYQVIDIFRIARQGEKDRFDKSKHGGPPRDRRLLWHGSRCTNFGGILSQGLRIAPPEAPVSGYMFGKGIYLADMSSKSANYCCSYISGGQALLLLCEAELGDPMQTLTHASYNAGEDALAKGLSSTWGQGTTGPSLWKDAECVHPDLAGIKMPDTSTKPGRTGVNNASLLYNEYITYDIAQVRLRYLLRVKM